MSPVYAYYPGCTLHSTAKEYDVSARLVCEKLGIELRELKDWICCGASSAHSASRLLSIALAAHELKAAEEMGLPLAVACAMCYSRLKIAAHEMADEATLNQVREAVGDGFRNTAKIVHLLEFINKKGEDLPLTRSLEGLTTACYYGCLLTRPRGVADLSDEENPQIMDRLMETLGARSIDWGFKTECCGASLPFSRPEVVLKLSHRILYQAKQKGADCVVVACPMCHSNLDMYQKNMEAEYKDDFMLPVIYFTQLLGLALGFSPTQLMLDKHFTDPLPMLEDKIKGLDIHDL